MSNNLIYKTQCELQNELDNYKQLVSDVLAIAKRKGATDVEVEASLSDGVSIEVRKGDIDKLEFNRDKGIGISVYLGKASASVSSSDTNIKSLESTIDHAIALAKVMEADEYSGIAEKELLAFDYNNIDLDLYHPWDVSIESLIDLAKDCEKKAFELDKRIVNSDGSFVNTFSGLSVYGNSNGFIGSDMASRHSHGVSLIAKENEDMQTDYWSTVSRSPKNLQAIDIIAKKAVERTASRLGAKKISTRKTPVIFNFSTAKTLIGSFLGAISGGALYRGASFLLNQKGNQVFSDKITLVEKPHLLQGLGSAAFDGDGVRTKEKVLVDKGILNGYLLSCYSARRLGMQTTGNAGGVHNLHIDLPNDAKSFDELVKELHNGIIITDLMGQGINTITGDYSQGAFGYMVENGKITYPVREITVASNLKDMYKNIMSIGSDVDTRGNVQIGSLLIDNMMVASN